VARHARLDGTIVWRGEGFEMHHLAVIAAMAFAAVQLALLIVSGDPSRHPPAAARPLVCPDAGRTRRSGRSARPGHRDHRCGRPATGFWSEEAARYDWPQQVPVARTHLR
jgi:hypothetical protein